MQGANSRKIARVPVVVGTIALATLSIACEVLERPVKPDPVPSAYAGRRWLNSKLALLNPPYKDLLRNIESHQGKLVWYRAKVSQVLSSDDDAYQVHAPVQVPTVSVIRAELRE